MGVENKDVQLIIDDLMAIHKKSKGPDVTCGLCVSL